MIIYEYDNISEVRPRFSCHGVLVSLLHKGGPIGAKLLCGNNAP